jgi:hypothetical protein
LKLPKSWNDITVEQFIELRSLNNEDFDSLFSYEIECLSILTDIDVDEFDDMEIDELSKIVKQVTFIKKQPSNIFKNEINNLTYIGLNDLKLGEFIDLEYYFANDYVKHLTYISSVLYRKTKLSEWEELIFEDYSFNIEKRKELFNDLPITSVYGIIAEYIKFRENFLKVYENLFNPIFDDEELDEAELDEEDLKEQEAEDKINRWSWEHTLYNLANEDVTKIKDVLELNLVFAFNILGMKKELEI